ncbi:MAG TPA: CDP-alcohol phosphatidyltransferase family protein [Afifellaceae bacterium]|nr:CDP-alcohol phosphatidyltransferase family protein [Afifellaceae bacterium]
MTIPNFITVARLLAVPLIVWLMIRDLYLLAAVAFAATGISDAVDGFIARRYGQSSELGGYLDPIADKVLLVSVFVTLGFKGVLPLWLIMLAVSRDLLIVGAVILAWMVNRPLEMRPHWVSKFNTAAQVLLVALALGERAGVGAFAMAVQIGIFVVAASTVLSAASYLREWNRHMSGDKHRAETGSNNP